MCKLNLMSCKLRKVNYYLDNSQRLGRIVLKILEFFCRHPVLRIRRCKDYSGTYRNQQAAVLTILQRHYSYISEICILMRTSTVTVIKQKNLQIQYYNTYIPAFQWKNHYLQTHKTTIKLNHNSDDIGFAIERLQKI